jgi:capsular polysaccharide biosynthesis protein
MVGDTRSLWDLVAQPDGGVTYLPLCDQRISIPAAPRFTFGDAPNDLMRRYYSECLSLPVGLFAATGVDLAFDSLLMKDNTYLRCDELQMHSGMLPQYIEYHRSRSTSSRIRYEHGTCVLLLGMGYQIYGHWLADFLPKLFVLHRAGCKLNELKILVPDDTPRFGIDLLNLSGITLEQCILYNDDEVVRADRLLIPTMVRTNSRTSPLFGAATRFVSSLIWTRNLRPSMPEDRRRIFVSRALADRHMRGLLNRDRIEQIATEAGFAIVHPEQMPLLEQFAMFSAAREIVGEYGSAMHATMFSSAGTTVGLLRGTGSPVAAILQSAIGDSLEHPTGYIFGQTIEGDPLERFTVNEEAWRTCLDLIFSGRAFAESRFDR